MIPAAWYGLAGSISHAKAVASCMIEATPPIKGGTEEWLAMCRVADLAGALEDLLTMAEADVEELERELARSRIDG